METLMAEAAKSNLKLMLPRNAVFLAERLCAQFPSEVNDQLLATCYLHDNRPYAAYHILKGKQMPECRYLFAMSCFRMDLLQEAEVALCPSSELNAEIPCGAAGHYLLGLIYRYTNRETAAANQFMQALSLDPLFWAAFEELCLAGSAKEASEYFNDSNAVHVWKQHLSTTNQDKSNCISESGLPSSNTNLGFEEASQGVSKKSNCNNTLDVSGSRHVTEARALHAVNSMPPNNPTQFKTPPPTVREISLNAPPPIFRNVPLQQNVIGIDASPKSKVNANQQLRRKYVDEARIKKVTGRLFPRSNDSGPRRSTRINNNNASAAARNVPQPGMKGTNNSSDYASVDSSAEVPEDRCTKDESVDNQLSKDWTLTSGVKDLLALLRILGEGFRLSCLYRCLEALEVYKKLSEEQFNTGWVLAQVGKAHFEMVDYKEADQYFEYMRRVSPCMLEGMDIYSTVLYHLKEEVRLNYLAQELILIDRLSPQAWCAVGNCYALRQDHENALKNFQRAVQLNSRVAYAHTLCGHEYSALEDYESSIRCFQHALQVDERHYNAWHGLGVVYLRQERFQFADHHFRKAFQINPRSSIITCYLGMTLHALKRNADALEMVDKAIVHDKKNPLPRYYKAQILYDLERYDEAIEELERVKESVPNEGSLYALMGRIYMQLDIPDKAMFCFGVALDLKPTAADIAAIKSMMEKIHLPDDFDEP